MKRRMVLQKFLAQELKEEDIISLTTLIQKREDEIINLKNILDLMKNVKCPKKCREIVSEKLFIRVKYRRNLEKSIMMKYN